MNKLFRRGLLLVLCIALMAGIVPAAHAGESDEVRAAKKIISVVCDDSGSMKGDKWTFANYATQALIAQLNEQDELYITFMSKPGKSYKIDMKDLKGEVKAMGERPCPGSTPYASINTAHKALINRQTSDSSDQYWLIVTTDGDVENIPKSGGTDGTIQSVLDKHKGETMSNGSKLNVAYLAMDAKYACTADSANGLHTFTASTPQEISQALSSISNLISSRLQATPLTQVDDKTVSFTTPLPLYSFSILSQQSSATVTGASTGDVKLRVDRNIPLKKDQLFGNASVVNSKNLLGQSQVIQAGSFTVTFSEKVDVANLLIQYEPAIEVKMKITSNGRQVDDPADLIVGHTMTVELVPVIPGTDTLIDPAALPAGSAWRIDYQVDGTIKGSADSTSLPENAILEGDNVIRGTLKIPGFSDLVFEKRFTLRKILFGLTASRTEDPTYPRKSPQKSVTPDNRITITVTDDGVPIPKEKLELLGVTLKTSCVDVDSSGVKPWFLRGLTEASIRYEMNDDGTFTLVPRSPFWKAFLVLAGDYTVTAALAHDDTVTAISTFKLVPSLADFVGLFWWLLAFFLLTYLCMLLCKKKFTGQTVQFAQYSQRQNGTGECETEFCFELTPLGKGSLFAFSFKPCSVTCQGVKFIAGEDGAVLVSGRSVARNRLFVAYGTSTQNPEKRLRGIIRGLTDIDVDMGEKSERSADDTPLDTVDAYCLKTRDGLVYYFRLL